MIIPEHFEPPVRILSATIPGGEIHATPSYSIRLEQITNEVALVKAANALINAARPWLKWFTNGMGNTFIYDYNENGNLDRIITPWNPLGVKNEYDREETFEYNDRNQKIHYTEKNGNTTRYAYDNQGNLAKVIDPMGQKYYMIYDKRNLLLNMKYPNGTSIKYSYNENGKLIETVDRRGYSTKIEYVNSHGKRVKYLYDKCLRLSDLADGIQNVRYRYNKNGLLQEKLFSNSLKVAYFYNQAGQLISLIDKETKKILDEYHYTYDSVGNKTGINKIRTGILSESGDFQYEYNVLNQITRVLRNGKELREYGYDAFGNRILKKEGENETNYIYNANNQLIKQTGEDIKDYKFDLRGNLRTVSVDGIVTAGNYMEKIGSLRQLQLNGRFHQCSIYSTICSNYAEKEERWERKVLLSK